MKIAERQFEEYWKETFPYSPYTDEKHISRHEKEIKEIWLIAWRKGEIQGEMPKDNTKVEGNTKSENKEKDNG